MGIITGRCHLNPLEKCKRSCRDKTIKKLLKGHGSGKNQLSMTSIKYDHLQVMGTITGKFHQNSLKTVGGVAKTRTVDKMAKTDNGP